MKGATLMMDQSWQAKNDMTTLHEAMQIRKDKKRMSAVKAMMNQTQASVDVMAGVPKNVKPPRKGK